MHITEGTRVRILPGAKPARIAGATGTVVSRNVLTTRAGHAIVELAVALDGHRDFGRGENRYSVGESRVASLDTARTELDAGVDAP